MEDSSLACCSYMVEAIGTGIVTAYEDEGYMRYHLKGNPRHGGYMVKNMQFCLWCGDMIGHPKENT